MIAALAIILTLAALVIGFSYFAYRIAFYSPYRNRDSQPTADATHYDPYREVMKLIYNQLAKRPFEEVTITSQDGLRLYGRYYHVKDGAPVCIGFHGYRSSPMTDFSGGADLTFSMNHNLLLVHQRAHGKSRGRSITFGIRECRDCVDWVDYVLDRFGENTQILLYGISMGASTVLMASGISLPDNVRGIVADCPYGSAGEIIRKVSDEMRIPSKLAYPFIVLGARLFGGFDLEETDAFRAVKYSRVPILIIHGEADSFVPAEMSQRIQKANPTKVKRYTFPGAEHGISYLVDTPRYRKLVEDFVSSVLK